MPFVYIKKEIGVQKFYCFIQNCGLNSCGSCLEFMNSRRFLSAEKRNINSTDTELNTDF